MSNYLFNEYLTSQLNRDLITVEEYLAIMRELRGLEYDI